MRSGDLLAVYGSLRLPYSTRRNLGIDGWLEWECRAAIRGDLVDLGAYPALVSGSGTVTADLFRVNDDRVAGVLDPFEGYEPARPDASMYVRERVSLIRPAGVAWLYRHRGPLPGAPRVPGGDWVAHLEARSQDGSLGVVAGP